jgi:hypothetical protein
MTRPQAPEAVQVWLKAAGLWNTGQQENNQSGGRKVISYGRQKAYEMGAISYEE